MTDEQNPIFEKLSDGDVFVLCQAGDHVEYLANIGGVVHLKTAYLEK